MYGCANIADVELKFTTAASRPSSRAGMASRIMRKVPTRFTWMTCWNWSSVVSAVCEERRMPAAFTSTSRPPSASTAAATPAATEASSPMLTSIAVRRSAASPALATVSARPAALTSAATTRPPSASMRSTVA